MHYLGCTYLNKLYRETGEYFSDHGALHTKAQLLDNYKLDRIKNTTLFDPARIYYHLDDELKKTRNFEVMKFWHEHHLQEKETNPGKRGDCQEIIEYYEEIVDSVELNGDKGRQDYKEAEKFLKDYKVFEMLD